MDKRSLTLCLFYFTLGWTDVFTHGVEPLPRHWAELGPFLSVATCREDRARYEAAPGVTVSACYAKPLPATGVAGGRL